MKFVTCVGIASVRLGEPSIHNHIGEKMSKRPPLGKLALAGKRKHKLVIASSGSAIARACYPW